MKWNVFFVVIFEIVCALKERGKEGNNRRKERKKEWRFVWMKNDIKTETRRWAGLGCGWLDGWGRR